MKCILFLVVLTVAVSALESENDSYAEAQDLFLQQSSNKNACLDLAKATEDEVRANIKASQSILDGLDNGATCKDAGQSAVKDAEKQLDEKVNTKKQAAIALTKAQGATVNWGSSVFSSVTEGNCDIFYKSPNYVNTKAKVTAAKKAKTMADDAVKAFLKALQAAIKAAVKAARKCMCTVYGSHTKALASSKTKVEKANKNAWAKAANLRCVIKGTSSSDCKVPNMPTVKMATLADGVSSKACDTVGDKCFALAKYWAPPSTDKTKCTTSGTNYHMDGSTNKKIGSKWGDWGIHLGEARSFTGFSVNCGSGPAFLVQYSDNGQSWHNAASHSTFSGKAQSSWSSVQAGSHKWWRVRWNGSRSGSPWYQNFLFYENGQMSTPYSPQQPKQ